MKFSTFYNQFLFIVLIAMAQWAFIAQNGMEKAPKSTVFSTIFNNGNLYMTIRQPRIHF